MFVRDLGNYFPTQLNNSRFSFRKKSGIIGLLSAISKKVVRAKTVWLTYYH